MTTPTTADTTLVEPTQTMIEVSHPIHGSYSAPPDAFELMLNTYGPCSLDQMLTICRNHTGIDFDPQVGTWFLIGVLADRYETDRFAEAAAKRTTVFVHATVPVIAQVIFEPGLTNPTIPHIVVDDDEVDWNDSRIVVEHGVVADDDLRAAVRALFAEPSPLGPEDWPSWQFGW
jgi:hypothetical protein